MNEFTSGFWPFYIAIVTVISIIVCAVFLYSQQSAKITLKGGKVDTTGHVWDEDLREWNNPLPNWWRWLFYITVVFGLLYVVLYPGLGLIRGYFGWSSGRQYEDEMKKAEAQYAPLYQKYAAMSVEQLAADPGARQIGQNLYLNYCAQCHASDAGGSKGFPNLRDNDWQWGGAPAAIEATIANGRRAVMPPFGQALGGEGTKDVANYVMSLSGMAADPIRVAKGKPLFAANCAACHGPEGTGNPALGAPNLTDKSWLYGSAEPTIIQTIGQGRNGVMPPWKDRLGEEKAKLLTAYVWGLSNAPAK